MKRLDLEELERIHKAATPEPWFTVELPWRAQDRQLGLMPTYVVAGDEDPHKGTPVLDSLDIMEWDEEGEQTYGAQLDRSDANLAVAVAARNALPALIARVRTLEKELAKLREILEVHPPVEDDCSCAECECDCHEEGESLDDHQDAGGVVSAAAATYQYGPEESPADEAHCPCQDCACACHG